MAINALSYIGVNSDRIEDWSDYSRKCLGMQQVDRAKDSLSFRMDDQKQRLVVTGDTGDSLAFMGWEVEKKEDLKISVDFSKDLNFASRSLFTEIITVLTYINLKGRPYCNENGSVSKK